MPKLLVTYGMSRIMGLLLIELKGALSNVDHRDVVWKSVGPEWNRVTIDLLHTQKLNWASPTQKENKRNVWMAMCRGACVMEPCGDFQSRGDMPISYKKNPPPILIRIESLKAVSSTHIAINRWRDGRNLEVSNMSSSYLAWWKKVSVKAMDLHPLKMALNVSKFSSPSYRKQVDLFCEYGLGKNVAFETKNNFRTWK